MRGGGVGICGGRGTARWDDGGGGGGGGGGYTFCGGALALGVGGWLAHALLTVPQRLAFAHDHRRELVAGLGVERNGAAASEQLIVRMRSDDEHTPGIHAAAPAVSQRIPVHG